MRFLKFLVLLLVITVLGGAALGGSLALLVPAGRQLVTSASEYGPLRPELVEPAQRSYLYDRNGNLMTTLFSSEDRAPVKLAQVPKRLIDAVVAIEDRRFYEHDGIDPRGVWRALFKNVESGEVAQGGSTITQQLVKNTLIEKPKRDFKTKAREAILALRLENELTKDEILERYLNIIYLGNGAYGVQAASERYFNKSDLRKLTLGEAALLAGLIQSPEALNPIKYPEAAARRRSVVLDAMLDEGMITASQARSARQEPLPRTGVSPLHRTRDYFIDEVQQRLLHVHDGGLNDPAEYLGANSAARYNAVFNGGLRIHTTYDPDLQAKAQQAVTSVLPVSPFTASMVVIDNSNGAVRAMVAGPNFQESEFNLATDGVRQTGSSFKAITLATALALGYSPNDSVSGSSFYWDNPLSDSWEPLRCSGGTMSLTSAVVRSNNCAFARTIISLGPTNYGADGARRVIAMANQLGIDTEPFRPVPSVTLGTQPTSPLDMAEAFSVFANEGVHRDPVFVTKIEAPDGKVLYEAPNFGRTVLSPEIARTETSMLEGVIESGTGTAADIGRPAAGKTGTTNDNADAWFVGYTPQLTASVWMGHPKSREPMTNVGGITVQGGTYPARIWAAFMGPALDGQPVIDFTEPDSSLWPPGGRISEDGRNAGRSSTYIPPPSTTTPSSTAPRASTTTAPRATTTTAPPPSTTTTAPPPSSTTTSPGP